MQTNKKEPPLLSGDAALRLWKQGKDQWNQWVRVNPVATVDFVGIDFAEHSPHFVSFREYIFPIGTRAVCLHAVTVF